MGSRRDFLKSSLIAGAALPTLALANATAAATPAAPLAKAAATPLPGRLLMAGFGGKRQSNQHGAASSVVTELHLADGTHKQAALAMANAHTLLPLPGGEYLCLPLDGTLALFIDHKLEQIAQLTAPTGFLFSGHGAVTPNRGQAFISLRLQNARSFNDHGRMGIVDLAKRQLVGAVDSGGVRPHDIASLAGGKQLAVSHYGDINYEAAGKTHANAREPRLVIMDAATGHIVKTIAAPNAGSLTHIAAADDGLICGVPLNYFGMDEQGRRAVEAAVGGKPFEVSVAEELEGRLGAPMPAYLFDSASGKVQTITGDDPARQRRAQSVAYHPKAKAFFITYTFSDTLASVNTHGMRYVSAFDLGLSFIRGVCAVAGTDLLAVSGEFRGVALVDATSLRLVQRYDVALFDNPHIVYDAART